MNFIRNLNIKAKLTLLLLLLLIPLIYFVIVTVRQGLNENRELESIAIDLTESEKVSEFIHQFQREIAQILAAGEGDSLMHVEALVQREHTDAAIRDLKVFFETENRPFTDISLTNQLSRYRSDLDLNKLDNEGFRVYSVNLIYRFLDRIDENAAAIGDKDIGRSLQSFIGLVETKVHLGRIRGLLTRAVGIGNFSYKRFGLFSLQKGQYQKSLNDFIRYASPQGKLLMHQLAERPDYKEMVSLLQLFESDPAINLSVYDPAEIYDLISFTIDEFKNIEDQKISAIRASVSDKSTFEKGQLYYSLSILLLILGIALVLSLYIIKLISSSLSSLKIAADRVKLGASDVEIEVYGNDEIGDVANSFRGLIQKNINLINVAQEIGKGNYAVEVDIYSKQDVLSTAIQDMKDNMQRFSQEGARRNWIMSGITTINSLVTAETTLKGVAEKVINFMCEYTASEAGVLYLHNNEGRLVPQASYGINVSLDKLSSFQLQTGKVGQAVSENKIKVLADVPPEYLKFNSGLAEIVPSTVIILPLHFTQVIVGALELSARHEYTELEMDFFKSASERVSILLHTFNTHLQTKELLHETQNQAEELETQQEELRQLNAELMASEEELKVSQEELQEKNSELEEKAQLLEEQFEAVGNKNQALEDARKAIEMKMQQVETVSKYKSDFLANMSHELRTPLNSILILSRLLADNKDQNLSDKQAEHAHIIHRSGADLLKLINEILDLSKIESGQIRLEIAAVRISDLAIEETFKELSVSKKISFSVEVDAGMPEYITTDRFRLEQILRNFLSNALKFTPEGGKVTLSVYPIKNKKNFNSVQLNKEEEIIAFAVRDTGIGIAQHNQELIFEAFQQADTSTTRKYGGTGLGLTISRELAALLGGEIELQSEEDKGSTFILYLPAKLEHHNKAEDVDTAKLYRHDPVQQSAAEIHEILDNINHKQNKEVSLLIIEDDKGFSNVLADFSLAKNFKVHQAYTGNEGLRIAREVKPDAILLDINLPDISGWEVLKQIREIKDLHHVNVHVMSAYDREVMDSHHMKEEYLPKPVTLEMLNKAFTSIGDAKYQSIEKVLIVEDNNIENQAIAELLQSHGLASVSAYDAQEAEQILSRQKIDCIILDINLPGIKGNVWMETIKAKKGLADIPIIIYSGKDLSEAEEAKLKQFANTVIIKNEYSYIRLLDEVQLFLHKVNQKLPTALDFKMKLHVPEEVLKNKKALVVDDDVRNVYSLCSLLEMQGMEMVVAYDGKEALEKLNTEKGIDIVLMDVMMPEMDGIEAIKHIRQNLHFKQLPIIALTAKAMKGDKDKCLEVGASDYITKPVDTDKLLTLMRVWLYEA